MEHNIEFTIRSVKSSFRTNGMAHNMELNPHALKKPWALPSSSEALVHIGFGHYPKMFPLKHND